MLNRLPAGLRKQSYIATLGSTSKDPSRAPSKPPCASNFNVVKLENIFIDLSQAIRCHKPKDCDALYIAPNGDFALIEFKNTNNPCATEILQKLYDSLIALIELKIIKDIQFARERGCFVLVYHPDSQDEKEINSSYMSRQGGGPKQSSQKFRYLNDLLDKGYVLKAGAIQSFESFNSILVPLIEKDSSILNAVSTL